MHKLCKAIFRIAFSLFLFSAALQAQNDTISSNIWDNLPRIKALPQEKVYLHFDKPYYVAGDRMWFRAYLVNADTHKPDTASCAIYVELINSKDSLILRQKIRHKNGVFDGGILLDETTPEGIYTVRAYTNWMRNAGSDYFYNRQFFVGNSIASQVQSTIRYTFYNEKRVGADIRFLQKDLPLTVKRISYYLNLKGQARMVKYLTTNANGEIHVEYNPQQIDIQKPFIFLTYEENLSKYERTYILPSKSEYDVQFFPEGGSLVSGTSNCIAFKAIQSDGFSTEITGKLFDNNNVEITDFKSMHLGMGKFYFLPDSTKRYYVLVQNSTGDKKRIDLPEIKRDAFLLNASVRNKRVFIAIKSDIPVQKSDSLILVGHSRGAVFFNTLVSGSRTYTFDQSGLRPGIISFLLVNKKGEPLSERLVFIKPDKTSDISLTVDKKNCVAREKVSCNIKVLDAKGNPVQGSFSMAATDASDIAIDSTAENILNTLLLSSDLKGYIEKPNMYFDSTFKQADYALDVLMMTQGWKRFDTQKLLRGEKEKADHFLEAGQAISGSVATGLANKLTNGTKVSILGARINYFDIQETNEAGRFSFSKFQFPDSTLFNIYVSRSRGLKNAVEIRMDEDSFPTIRQTIIRPEKATAISDNYLESAEKKFVFENGMRNINLKDVEIISTRDEEESLIDDAGLQFFNEPDYVLRGVALDRFKGRPLSALIRSLPGLQTWNENMPSLNHDASIYGDSLADELIGPQFASDGNIYTYTEVQGVDINYLSSVAVLKASNVGPGKSSNFNDILVVLNFKKNFSVFTKPPPPNIITIMPLGFAKDVVFYQPKYEVESIHNNPTPDWRSTIAWQAEVKTDANGIGTFWFYTADRPNNYNIVIEGVSPAGEICRTATQLILFNKTK